MKGRRVLLNVGILIMFICLVLDAKTSAWTGVDIGDCPATGTDSYDPNTGKWTLQGDGQDIWGRADGFHYVYKYLEGDGSLTARVVGIGGPGTDEWRKAGVMMREDLTGGSRHTTMAMTPTEGHSASYLIRQFSSELSFSFSGGSYSFPYWVRILREGDTFTGYISSDGNDWQQQGCSVTIGMKDDRRAYAGCYVGLCLTSHESGTLASSEFDNVSFTGNVTDEQPPVLKAWNPDPQDGADYVTTSLFQWTGGDTAEWHDVYFGTNPVPGPAEFITRQEFNVNVYEHDANLLADTTYYWRIDEVEADETTIHTGDVWSFTTAPATAWSPNPADGDSFVDLREDLSWFAGMGAATHDVYFGTNEAAVTDGNSGTFKGNQSDTTFEPGTLARYTSYYWRIDEVEADGNTRHTGDVWSFTTRPRSATYDISASSYIGGSSVDDSVRGCAIQSDGTVVLAANISDATPGGVTPILLNGATSSSPGTIVRLSPDGTTVLSVTRVADLVLDLVVDDSNNLYVALWTQGMVKLNPTATSVLWSKTPESGNIMRLDAGPVGYCVTLKTSASDPDTAYPGSGEIAVYDPNGAELGSFPGYRRTFDVCIDEVSQTVVHTGWRQADIPLGALQVAYIQGRGYTGTIVWTAYDWSTYPDSDRYINRPGLNMADTQGLRCCIGRDGKLYCASIFHGGMHMQRYDPFDIMKPVEVVGGDMWFETWNTGNIHETFVGRYEPATGEYLLGQQFTCRLSDTTGNTVTVDAGEICADELGRVYVGGRASWGLPLPGHPAYMSNPHEVAFNPLSNDYLGGAWLMVLSPDFTTRLYCTRLTFEQTHAIAARVVSGELAQIVFGGYSTSELYTKAAIQDTLQGDQDGWFAVIPPKAAPTILYVDSNAPGDESGTSWSDAFNCLQDGLYAAITNADVDEVRVAQGVYTPDSGRLMTRGDRTATFQLINGIAIKGGYAGFGEPDPNARDIYAYETILSGDLDGNDVEVNDPCDLPTEPSRTENCCHLVTGSGTDATSILDGFIITGGNANLWPDFGAGLYNDTGSPTVTNCTFANNSAKRYGGGMYNKNNSNPTLTNCTLVGNWARYTGAGIFNQDNSSPTLENCTFTGNSANDGGGMCSENSSATLTNCIFNWNSADWRGGGMFNYSNSSTTLTCCTFIGNLAGDGGGVYVDESSSMLTNCTFSGNSASSWGGGMLVYHSSPTITNCVFSGNLASGSGGAMFNRNSSPTLINCTITVNSTISGSGGGMRNWDGTQSILTNSILWGNTDIGGSDESAQIHGDTPEVTFSCIQDDDPNDTYIPFGGADNDNIDDDPMFVRNPDPGSDGQWDGVDDDFGDLHLLPGSPCFDAGDPNFMDVTGDVDMDGQPRVVGGCVDIGADEFVYIGDLDFSGSVDMVDLAMFAAHWPEIGCGTCGGAELTGDGKVGVDDLRELVANWLAGL
jgi:parallel beta-helix repeat protein